eukprot:m.13109 g.13109  ORF g.13109 m.13109 type:complete len:244 (-) comp5900_c0_seq1:211-942(-)
MVLDQTIPRRAPAASLRGPGPAVYGIPSSLGTTSDPRRARAPAYSMGTRAVPSQKNTNPGPEYRPKSSQTYRGASSSFAYTLSGRPRDGMFDTSPGPAQYAAPNLKASSLNRSLPAYSLRLKGRDRSPPATPGPGNYNLPSLISSSAESTKRSGARFTASMRLNTGSFDQDTRRTPAPNTYSLGDCSVHKKRSPTVKLGGRPRNMRGEVVPGPGQYNPRRKAAVKGGTFGSRHSDYVHNPLVR